MARVFKIIIILSSLVLASTALGTQTFCQLTHIYDNTAGTEYKFSNFSSVYDSPNFDASKPTTIFLVGFSQNINSDKVKTVIDAYRTNGGYNFFVLWCGGIVYTVLNAVEIGESVANGIVELRNNNNYDNFHIVGFSLGAQIAGEIGKRVIAKSTEPLDRITGLDPGQIPILNFGLRRLNTGDAKFVDTVHCETNGFGDANTNGDVTFWVNGGNRQPGCTHLFIPTLINTCSHERTTDLWAESVKSKNPNKFLARQCSSFSAYTAGQCDSAPTNNMGLFVNRATTGTFHLRTNANSPFSITN